MIQNVGYTNDGLIFITVKIDQGEGGPRGDIIIHMTRERAKEISEWLQKAVNDMPEKMIN